MTDRFPDAALDLGSLPAPAAIKTIDYEAILAARLADFAARMKAAGIDYDVSGIESDPGVILQEEDAVREMIGLEDINDAVRAVMPLYASGSDQDNLFALVGVRRRELVPADPTHNPPIEAVMEKDPDFLARAQVALEASAPGLTGGGYATVALRASPEVKRVALQRRPGGCVDVILQGHLVAEGGSADDGSVSLAARLAVRQALNDDWSSDPATGSQLTDVVQVMSAEPVPYRVVARAVIPRGPSSASVKGQSEAAIAAACASLQLSGGTVPTDALIAAGRLTAMVKFILDEPAADVACTPYQVPHCTGITVTPGLVGG